MELARNDVLDGEFGTPADGARPLLRVTAHVRTATFRWIGAAIGGYHDGENALADQLEGSFRPGHAQSRRPRLLCAMRRTVVSPAQRAGMRGDYLWI